MTKTTRRIKNKMNFFEAIYTFVVQNPFMHTFLIFYYSVEKVSMVIKAQ